MAIRVYLDTNIVGGYLRDFPDKVHEFKKAESLGYKYYASTDVISELAINPNKSSFISQIGVLRQLVSDNCFYRQPKKLIQREILRLTGACVVPLLVEADEIMQMVPIITSRYYDPESHNERKKQLVENAKFFRFSKASVKMITPKWKDMLELPDTFQAYWVHLSSSKEFEVMIYSICRDHSWVPTGQEMRQLRETLQSYKTLYTAVVSSYLFPYSQLMQCQHPNKGDSMDIRHAAVAAYCDIFLSRDANLRDYLNIAAGVLSYKVMAPEEFLAAVQAV